jgi:uncharacterized membrane protein YgaE (UPF0421/DUF939 family)
MPKNEIHSTLNEMTHRSLGLAIGLVLGGLVGSLIGNPIILTGGFIVLGLAIGSALDNQDRKDTNP